MHLQNPKPADTTEHILQIFEPRQEVYVTADASKNAIGAALQQELQNGCYSIAFTSKTLNDA